MATLDGPQPEKNTLLLKELSDRFHKMAVQETPVELDALIVAFLSTRDFGLLRNNFASVKTAVAALTDLNSRQQSTPSLRDITKAAAFLDELVPELLSLPPKNAKDDVPDALLRFIGALTRKDLSSPPDTEEIAQLAQELPVAELTAHFAEIKLPPDDFRQFPAVPLASELLSSAKPFLRPNIVQGSYQDLDHYLDVQYRLLREDFVRPLREGIRKYLVHGTRLRQIDDINVYENVTVQSSEVTLGGITHTIAFRAAGLGETQWDKSKRFMNNSLLCLSNDGFRTIYFAVVVLRQPYRLKTGFVKVVFQDLFVETVSWDRYTMVETQIYFEAYKHNMLALQRIATGALPFYRYIVQASSDVRHPSYLDAESSYDIGALLKQSEKVKQTRRVQVLNETTWPDLSELDLDASQLAAVKSSLQKEFSVIQGPPGTGKTFVGLRIVQILLTNKRAWNSDGGPILVVCYTNHALDQFLEGILRCTDKIVRLGGRCSSEPLRKFTITELRRKNLHTANVRENVKCILKCRTILCELSKKLTSVYTVATQFRLLEPYMSARVKSSFKSRPYAIERGFHLWLDIESLKRVFLENSQRDAASSLFRHQNLDQGDLGGSPDDGDELYGMSLGAMGRFGDLPSNLDQAWCIYVHELVSANDAATDDIWVQDVWRLHNIHRWRLYRYWSSMAIRDIQKRVDVWKEEQRAAQDLLNETYVCNDLQYLSRAEVVGATTTGAAKSQELLKRLGPSVVIVEEAAEVLEAHVVTSLAPDTKHLILIGDHKQLKPSNAVYELAVKYKMDVSLFERMLTNGMICRQLQVQHRMRPAFAKLLVPHFYERLDNHPTVQLYEDVRGVDGNLFFVNHAQPEKGVADSKSHSNKHEALFLVGLADYLLNQGYEPDQITILTTYSGQMFLLKSLAGNRKCGAVRITVVDDFQGEENDIILLSLVRSNPRGIVGFVRTPNRICVAMSRAKKGFYCVGNFDMIAKSSPIWEAIVKELRGQEATGNELRLRCQNHPDTVTAVRDGEDFAKVPEGGCGLACATVLSCGHTCNLPCHGYDRLHQDYKCKEPCERTCKNGHRCSRECGEDCNACGVLVPTFIRECGHTCDVRCCETEDPVCSEACDRLLGCGHRCTLRCSEPCECRTLVTAIGSCGHEVAAECRLSPDEVQQRCGMPCEKVLPCGHSCKKLCMTKCGTACAERVLVKCKSGHESETSCSHALAYVCKHPCDKQLVCGHKCQNRCGDPCTSRCVVAVDVTQDCGHGARVACHKRLLLVPVRDVPCETPVEMKCKRGHAVSVPCRLSRKVKEVAGRYSPRGRKLFTAFSTMCKKPCDVKLPCGHDCVGTCGTCQVQAHSCGVPCTRTLPCGHPCKGVCSEPCTLCLEPCRTVCAHGTCPLYCGYPCLPCSLPCRWNCPHYRCAAACFEECTRKPCDMPCLRRLRCGHPCRGYCGEPCPKICKVCRPAVYDEHAKDSIAKDGRFVRLVDCGHWIADEKLQGLFQASKDTSELVKCPMCQRPITFSFRYGFFVKRHLSSLDQRKEAVLNRLGKSEVAIQSNG